MTVGSVRRVDIHTPSSATGPAPLAEIPGFARAAGAPPFSLGRDLLGCEEGKAAARVSQAGTTCQQGFHLSNTHLFTWRQAFAPSSCCAPSWVRQSFPASPQ